MIGVVGGIVVAGLVLLTDVAGAAQPGTPSIVIVPGTPPVYPAFPSLYGQPLSCWSDVRLYSTLRYGNFPYCRQKMRYRPGALECFQVTEQVCWVIPAGSNLPIQTTSPVNKQVIPCPDGPEPPLCRRLDVE